MRVAGRHGLFPSWEGLGVGSLDREISVNISRITALPTPSPSQEGNNPCRPVTRINKMKIPIQSSLQPLTRDFLDFYNICAIVRLSAHDEVCGICGFNVSIYSG